MWSINVWGGIVGEFVIGPHFFNEHVNGDILTFSVKFVVRIVRLIFFHLQILVFFVRIVKPEPLADRLIEASRDEYVTRHLVDGRIINCDQRISYIAGYMSEEVSGLSAFNFMHREDVRWVMIALRQSK